MPERVLTDREEMLSWEQERRADAQAVDQATHYAALGAGLAVFCQMMFATLLGSTDEEAQGPLPFSRTEALELVRAAVQGR